MTASMLEKREADLQSLTKELDAAASANLPEVDDFLAGLSYRLNLLVGQSRVGKQPGINLSFAHVSPSGLLDGLNAIQLTNQVQRRRWDIKNLAQEFHAIALSAPDGKLVCLWKIGSNTFIYSRKRSEAARFYDIVEGALRTAWDSMTDAQRSEFLHACNRVLKAAIHVDIATMLRDSAKEDEEVEEAFLRALNKTTPPRETPSSPKEHSWETLILPGKTKELLRDLAMMWQNAARLPEGVNIPRAVLLYGPPGTGKTEIARTLKHELGIALFERKAGDFMGSKGGGSGIAAIRKIFDEARAAAPAILFIDELDGIAPADTSLHGGFQEVRPELLTQFEGFDKSEGLFFLAATNYPQKLDPAIRSRFTEQIEIPLPDEEGRVALIRSLLQRKPFDGDVDALAQRIAGRTEGQSGRAIVALVARAEMRAAKRAIASGSPESMRIRESDFD